MLATNFFSLRSAEGISPDFHMFTEDIHLGVMPIGGRTSIQHEFHVEINGNPSDCDKARMILSQLAKTRRQRDDPALVSEAVRSIAAKLGRSGRAVYEVTINDNCESVHEVTEKGLIKIGLHFIQIVPKKDRHTFGRRILVSPRERVWEINVPIVLGGLKGHAKALRKLRKINSHGPEFYMDDLKKGVSNSSFDFEEYTFINDIYKNKITNKWGWNRRDSTQDRNTEFYAIFKLLTYRYSEAILREHIIAEINNLLERMSINCKVVVEGLPSPDEIRENRNRLIKGEISFANACNRTSIL